eukprot:m.44666 g.44666  ORF g.44666 m.44666 type:complete len:377 (-) comp13039_c0_seq1:131-1261(-)
MDYLHFAATNMVGSVVDVQVISGAVYRGVLTAIAADDKLGVTLTKAYLTKKTTSKDSLPFAGKVPRLSPEELLEKLVIPGDRLAQIQAVGVNLGYRAPPPSSTAAGQGLDGFTDTGISGGVGPTHQRPLQAFEFDGPDMSLEGDDGAGWSAEDMIRTHEQHAGQRSDFTDDAYSTTIDTSHPEYAERMRKADKLAKSMASGRKGRVAPEDRQAADGDDEAVFSSVDRSKVAQLPQRQKETDDLKEFSSSIQLPPGLSGGDAAEDATADGKSKANASGLNPNAPEFTFNANAEAFTPTNSAAAMPQQPAGYHPGMRIVQGHMMQAPMQMMQGGMGPGMPPQGYPQYGMPHVVYPTYPQGFMPNPNPAPPHLGYPPRS